MRLRIHHGTVAIGFDQTQTANFLIGTPARTLFQATPVTLTSRLLANNRAAAAAVAARNEMAKATGTTLRRLFSTNDKVRTATSNDDEIRATKFKRLLD